MNQRYSITFACGYTAYYDGTERQVLRRIKPWIKVIGGIIEISVAPSWAEIRGIG